MFDYSKLKGLIAEKNFTQRKLCKHIGISENSFTNKLNGRSNFSSEEIAAICNVLGINSKSVGLYFFTPKVWEAKPNSQMSDRESRWEYISRIEKMRKRKKLSQLELCKKIGISQKTYYNYVHTNVIPSDKLIELARIFKCSTDYLLGLSNYTSVIVTDSSNNVLAVIDSEKVIEHSGYKVKFLED